MPAWTGWRTALTALSHAEVLGYALAAGWTPRSAANMITVIANYESGDDPAAIGDQTLSKYGSIGLTQDFTGAHNPAELDLGSGEWTPELVAKLKDPLTNMKAALIIFKEQGFRAWSTYNQYRTTTAWVNLLDTVSTLTPVMPGVSTPAPDSSAKGYLDSKGNVEPGVAADVTRANAATTCTPGMCLHYVRTWMEIRLGAASAIQAWRAVPQARRHSFYTPPVGVPVFWSGGSRGLGHVAFSLGGGKVRTTDFPHSGHVATLDLTEISKLDPALTYLGWTEDLNGVPCYKEG